MRSPRSQIILPFRVRPDTEKIRRLPSCGGVRRQTTKPSMKTISVPTKDASANRGQQDRRALASPFRACRVASFDFGQDFRVSRKGGCAKCSYDSAQTVHGWYRREVGTKGASAACDATCRAETNPQAPNNLITKLTVH